MGKHENCRELLGSLSEYVDGSLQDELCAQLEHHLADCEDCRVVVDTLKKTIYLYQTTSTPANVPEEIRQRLYRRLNLDDFLGL